jgi:malate/lactate dehydrogenase
MSSTIVIAALQLTLSRNCQSGLPLSSVREVAVYARADLDQSQSRAVTAVATDMHSGVPLSPLVKVADGDYADLAGAGLTIITVGVNEGRGCDFATIYACSTPTRR